MKIRVYGPNLNKISIGLPFLAAYEQRVDEDADSTGEVIEVYSFGVLFWFVAVAVWQ